MDSHRLPLPLKLRYRAKAFQLSWVPCSELNCTAHVQSDDGTSTLTRFENSSAEELNLKVLNKTGLYDSGIKLSAFCWHCCHVRNAATKSHSGNQRRNCKKCCDQDFVVIWWSEIVLCSALKFFSFISLKRSNQIIRIINGFTGVKLPAITIFSPTPSVVFDIVFRNLYYSGCLPHGALRAPLSQNYTT